MPKSSWCKTAQVLAIKFAITSRCDHSGFVSPQPHISTSDKHHHRPTSFARTGSAMNSRPRSRIAQYFRKRFIGLLFIIGFCRLRHAAPVEGNFADFLGKVGVRLSAQRFAYRFAGDTKQTCQLCNLAVFYEYFCYRINYFRIFVPKVTSVTLMQIYKEFSLLQAKNKNKSLFNAYMSGNEVKKILRKWGIPLKNVAELMGESPQNLNSMLNAQDIKTGVVAKIAHAIKKPLYLFFQDNDDLKTSTEIAAEDKEMCLDKVPVYKCDPKDAIIAAKDEVIAAKYETIKTLQARIRDLEAQLHSSSTVLDNAPAVDIPSVGGCQTSAK